MLDDDTRNDAYAATIYLAARTGYGMSSGGQSITFFDRSQYHAAARELEAEGFVFERNDRDQVLLWTHEQQGERRTTPGTVSFEDIDDGVPEVSTERVRFTYDGTPYVYERWLSNHGSGSEYYGQDGRPTTAPFVTTRELEVFERKVDALCASYGDRLNAAKQHIVESVLNAANCDSTQPAGPSEPPAAPTQNTAALGAEAGLTPTRPVGPAAP